jgi:HSP20 family protein
MANLARFQVLDNTFDDLMRGFFVRPMQFENGAAKQFKVDVTEDDKSYRVRAEIPGVRKEDISVAVEGNQVDISAEVKSEKQLKDGERVLRTERYYGKLHRAFSVDQDIDGDATEAKYVDGVLELRLPKKASVSARRITVQ